MKKFYLVDINDAVFLDDNDERCSLISYLDIELVNLYEQQYYYSHLKNGYFKDMSKLKIISDKIAKKIDNIKVPNKIIFSYLERNPIEGVTYIQEPYSKKIFRVDDTLIEFSKVNIIKANKVVLSYSKDEIDALNTYIKNISFNFFEEENESRVKARIINFPTR